MPSFLPLTGTSISMGKVRNSYNLAGAASLNGTLGRARKNRLPLTDADVDDTIPLNTTTSLSGSFGGRRGSGIY